MKRGKLTLNQILNNLNKVQINKAPLSIEGKEALREFIWNQGFYIKYATLSNHLKQLFRLKEYNNIYSRGIKGGVKTHYCKQCIEDCLKISICLNIGLNAFEESTKGRILAYTCK